MTHTRESIVIRLYDTLTGDVRPLAQRDEGKVSLYACGPTVYDHPHLGHARQAMTYDVMRRYFEWRGLAVHHVANVTDIDDKIIARAQAENTTESAVATEWKQVYDDVMDPSRGCWCPGRGRRHQGRPTRLRALESGQARRADLALSVGRWPSWLAHRVRGDEPRHPRRWL
ncbi:MAG: hypothetical protein EBY49_09250 [Actinobacteria bacterium]|nr:hypothetical protein [Actinomycetota bacterium]